MVASRILSVSHSYGRRTMHGLLSADGVHVGVDRVEGLYRELLQDRK